MSSMRSRGKISAYTFYEHSFQDGVAQAWKKSPDGSISYLGRVEPGSTARLARTYAMNCRPSRIVFGVPEAFDGLLN